MRQYSLTRAACVMPVLVPCPPSAPRQGHFDVILNCASANIPTATLMSLLKNNGELVQVGKGGGDKQRRSQRCCTVTETNRSGARPGAATQLLRRSVPKRFY